MTLMRDWWISGYCARCHWVGVWPQFAASRLNRLIVLRVRMRVGSMVVAGIEIEIGARNAIEELEIAEQWHVRPHILDEQHLAPAAMADHDIGGEPLALQP